MAWTKSKAGGFTKYTQTLASTASDTITLSGAGCIVSPAADVTVHTADSAGGLDDSYSYELISTTEAAEECTVPAGSHMLKVVDVTGGGVVSVYVQGNSASQDTVTISGSIGADPS
ncbi:MAG: hypothetical protein CMI54_00680 [Parcubacteria group bacterium]|jgi:hypothetical protein|nr:hypothetical protein [Parcubacteria group bacterium]|tara:strand:- start:1592 stop:1939 length:348 start_codon:yes stop_codon:yes gene_type:complete